ncbi:carbon-nitrogen hydrolase family protein [Propionibacteriaceae bacterium Y2011]
MQNVTVSAVSGHPVQLAEPRVTDADLTRVVDHWTDRISRVLPDRPDLVVLPEMFDRPQVNGQPGPTQLPIEAREEFARGKGSRVRDALAEIAVTHHTYVTYPSYRVDDDGALVNALEFIGRDGGTAAVYDKIVPTLGEQAGLGIRPGDTVLAADLDFGRVSGIICFDLNFEQVRAAVAQVQPRLIVFPSAYHGGLMQNYWALSCRSFFVGAVNPPNRSAIIDPTGQEVASTSTYDWLITRTINLDYTLVHLDNNREKLLQLKQKYGPEVQIHDPGLVGMVIVYSHSDAVDSATMVAEFEMQVLDAYFADSTAHLAERGVRVPR